jgi:hypothetical protein
MIQRFDDKTRDIANELQATLKARAIPDPSPFMDRPIGFDMTLEEVVVFVAERLTVEDVQ